MQFDFDKFSKIAASVYKDGDGLYSLADALMVFRMYFSFYESHMGHPHPPINANQILRIIQNMPWIFQEDIGSYYPDVDLECYRQMIHQHFKTQYKNCDFNINHFFSGKIRELRFYETCY